MNPAMPLALELTKPARLADDLNTLVRSQLCSATHSHANCNSRNADGTVVIDGVDIVIDDNDIL